MAEFLPLGTLRRSSNLVCFVGVLIYFLRRPLGEAFRARREGIRLS